MTHLTRMTSLMMLLLSLTWGSCPLALSFESTYQDTGFPCQDPPLLRGNKSPTLNGMGYVFYTISPMGETFIEQEILPGCRLCEIGSGYGNIPIEALRKGAGHYTAFDLSPEHLAILKHRITQALGSEALERITFMAGHAPQDLPPPSYQFDAILMDKVIHFLSPEEIVQTLAWIKTALKPGGSVYVSSVSPYSTDYVQSVRDNYQSRLALGDPFPGYTHNVMDLIEPSHRPFLPYLELPPSMVFFAEPELAHLLEREGFSVTQSYTAKAPNDNRPTWQKVPLTALAEVIATWP